MTKDQFEAAIEAAGIPSFYEPRKERDVYYGYACFDNVDGEEVGFITYRDGEVVGYTIHGAI